MRYLPAWMALLPLLSPGVVRAETLAPLDAERAYYAPAISVPEGETFGPLVETLPPAAVGCRPVDGFDAAAPDEDHPLLHADGTRLLTAGGRSFRLTAPPNRLQWFSALLRCDARPGRPHLLMVETLDDRERNLTVTLTHEPGFRWKAPYQGEERFKPENQEDDGVRQDIGAGVYTGRDLPTSGGRAWHYVLFYPKADRIKATFSHLHVERDDQPNQGAAVGRIRVYAIDDSLPAMPVARDMGRRIGLYVPHPWFLYSHFGLPSRTREQRMASLERFVEYLKFCGLNAVQLHIVNGSDRASRAWYRGSRYYPPLQGDLIEELLPLCQREDIAVGLIVTPVFGPEFLSRLPDPGQVLRGGFTRDSFQIGDDGQPVTAFGSLVPDPLRPETQAWLLGCLEEVAAKARRFSCVTQIGFRVNGKIGVCYVSRERGEGADRSGYSEWDLREFMRETKTRVPTGRSAYEWLRADPARWEAWLDFRCRRTRDFWLRARDAVRKVNPGVTLLVACDLPSETPGTNVYWPAGYTARELLRHHGYDPGLFENERGIVIQRGVMVAADRFFARWGGDITHGRNPWAYKRFHYDSGAHRLYRTQHPRQVEFYHNYWEESPHPDPEYGADLRTATASPLGRFYFEPFAFSLAEENAGTMVAMGWERASTGHEHELRRWAAAFRVLPQSEPQVWDGQADGRRGVYMARRVGDALLLLSRDASGTPVELAHPAARSRVWRDVVSGERFRLGGGARAVVELKPYELRVLLPDAPGG